MDAAETFKPFLDALESLRGFWLFGEALLMRGIGRGGEGLEVGASAIAKMRQRDSHLVALPKPASGQKQQFSDRMDIAVILTIRGIQR